MNRLQISDRDMFNRAYASLEMPLADLSFAMMYVWKQFLDIRWKTINDNLCVFGDFEGNTALWGPPLPGIQLEETVATCFDEMRTEGSEDPRILYIPEEMMKVYMALEGYALSCQNMDYVYASDHLIQLPGRSLKSKRNMANRFQRNNSFSVADYDRSKHMDGCLALLKKWTGQKEGKIDPSVRNKFEAEIMTAEQTIIYAPALDLSGMVVLVDGNVEGFTFGERLTDSMANIVVEKTNLSIKGLAQFIFREFVRRYWANCQYTNTGEDWGVDYLAKTKLSYNPCMTPRNYSLTVGG